MEQIRELENSTVLLTEAINEADAKDLAEDPEVMVERTIKEIKDFLHLNGSVMKITNCKRHVTSRFRTWCFKYHI